jgi:tRNA-dihydrouridine synthase 2
VDFVVNERSLIFRTTALEKDRLIFQLGTCDPDTALTAARMVEADVAGIDVNMGCPKVTLT